MVFIETLHFDKYIYSPTTEYHKINDYTKIHITYIALISYLTSIHEVSRLCVPENRKHYLMK